MNALTALSMPLRACRTPDGQGGGPARLVRSDSGADSAVWSAAAIAAASLSVAIGEEHDDLNQKAVAPAPLGA